MFKTRPAFGGDEGIVWPYPTIPPGSCTLSTPDSQHWPRKTRLLSGNLRRSRLSSAQLLRHLIDQPVQIFIGLPGHIDLLDRMQHGSVMLPAELASDLRPRGFSQMLGQVHGDLPGIDDGARIVLGFDLHQAQSELLGHRLLNRLYRDLPGLRVDEILEH